MLSKKSLLVVGVLLFTLGVGAYLRWTKEQAQLQELAHCGKGLYNLFHGCVFDNPNRIAPLYRVDFPRSLGADAFSNTTEIFQYLITNQIIDNADAIKLSGQTPRPEDTFSAEKNIWCISADMGWDDDPETPYFFTRNLVITQLTAQVSDYWRADGLAGGKYVVVITRNGAAKIIHHKDLDYLFNVRGIVKKVLRP